MNKRIIVGLGNPGKDYEKTRHNVGFMALDVLAKKYGFPSFSHEKQLKAEVSGMLLGGQVTLLVKPLTFMNKSGEAVRAVLDYYNLTPEDLTVIYDDVDLAVGTVRRRTEGSAGTHNGMRDIVRLLGTKEFTRIRIGIAPDHPIKDLARFVLQRFSEDELAHILSMLDLITIGEEVEMEDE